MKAKSLLQLGFVAVVSTALVGCENLPGSSGTQGAVVGGAGGAAVGAAVGGSEHRGLGALLGGVLGAAGGYVIGANVEKYKGHEGSAAEAAARAQQNPVTAQQASAATSADVNGDGLVTLDEVVAMKQAGLSDQQMIDRLRVTGQVFELSADQKKYLLDHGVSVTVVDQMPHLNQSGQTLAPANQPISRQPTPQ